MSEVPDVVRARRIEIVDQDGFMRIGLAVNDDGSAAMSFFDREGRRRITVSTTDNDSPSILLYNASDKPAITLTVQTPEDVSLALHDGSGQPRVMIGLTSATRNPLISLTGPTGADDAIVGIAISADGLPAIYAKSADDRIRWRLPES